MVYSTSRDTSDADCEPRRTVRAQLKEHPVLASLAAFITIASGVNVGAVIRTAESIGHLATEDYVDAVVAQHSDQASQRFEAIEDNINRIRAYTEIVPQIKDLQRVRCMTHTTALDATINGLLRQFRDLTGEQYDIPECDVLNPG